MAVHQKILPQNHLAGNFKEICTFGVSSIVYIVADHGGNDDILYRL
jgi:hypothetical protein